MRLGWALLAICALAGGARAQANDAAARQAAREHYQKGSVAYDLGHYDQAIAEYEAAYQAFNEPTLLYNLGQAHKLARHWPQALHFYKMYLIKVPNAPNRAEVETKIATLNATLEQENKAHNAPPDQTIKPPDSPATAPSTPGSTPSTTPDAATAPVAPAATGATDASGAPATAPSSADRGKARTLKIAGIAVGAAGLALVAGGIVTGVLAKGAADDISKADANHQPYDPGKYSTYQTDLVLTGVLVGVGAAAAITGTTLAIIGMRRGRAQTAAWQIAPQLSPSHAGVTANIRF